MYERMANGWRMGRPETVCGNGSTLAHTQNIRKWLPEIIRKYDIARINDAGAGDLYWISQIHWHGVVTYRAFDLISRDPQVTSLDITRETMPACDAVLCRMVLNHLDQTRILMALELFRKSARYLIATQFDGENLPKRSPQFTRCDLRLQLGEPMERCQDGVEPECSLALWRL